MENSLSAARGLLLARESLRIALRTTIRGVVLGASLLLTACNAFTASEAERARLVTPRDFASLGVTVPEDIEKFETIKKTPSSPFSTQIEYAFIPGDATSDIKYISEILTFDLRFLDSAATRLVFDTVSSAVYRSSGIRVQEEPSLYPNKYKAKVYSLIGSNGSCVGNVLSARVHRSFYQFTIVGINIDSTDVWKRLFDERLASLE